LKIISWNVNGLRAVEKKGFLDFLQESEADILCVQEIKALESNLSEAMLAPPGYHGYFESAQKKGYSGVGMYTRLKPLSIKTCFADERFNSEGRIQIADFEDFVLFNLYFPNGTSGDERLNYKLAFCDQLLEEVKAYAGRKILICGDYNTAHREIDLKNPKSNEKNSGFLPIERAWIDRFIEAGFVDCFRSLHPETACYSWWTYRFNCRAKNVGWRIDYHFVNTQLLENLKEASILTQVMGSDHCPVQVTLDL